MTHVAALILAAGRARRFDADETDSKAVALLDGVPLLRRVAVTALASGAAPVTVVTGHAASAVVVALDGLPARIVHNAAYATGMASSLRTGVAALDPATAGVMVLLADMPLLQAATLARLIACFLQESGPVDAVVPVCDGRRGNPVLLARTTFPAIATLTGDQGARGLLADPAYRVIECAIDDPGIFIDIDTRASLEAVRASLDGSDARSR